MNAAGTNAALKSRKAARDTGGKSSADKLRENRLRYRPRWIAWSFIVAALAGCAAAALIRGGALEWYAVSVLLGITLFSGVLPWAAARGLSAERILPPEAAAAGEAAVIRVELSRRWRLPFVWITVEEAAMNEASMSPSTLIYRDVVIPGAAARNSLTYGVPHLRRGVYEFRDITVTVGDWLGLTAISTSIAARSELLVLPAMLANTGNTQLDAAGTNGEAAFASEDMEAWGGAFDDDGSLRQRALPGLGPDSRPYREGDSIRHLDFRAAARGRGLRVKSSLPEQAETAALYIDTSAASYGHDDDRFDACISRAALEAKLLCEAGVRVLVITGGWTYALGGEGAGGGNLHELLRLLGRLRAEENGAAPEEWLTEAALPAKCSVQVFSGNWRQPDRWLPLAAYAEEQGGRVSLLLAMEGKTVTAAMRDNEKQLENRGIRVRWVPVDESAAAIAAAGKGADSYATG